MSRYPDLCGPGCHRCQIEDGAMKNALARLFCRRPLMAATAIALALSLGCLAPVGLSGAMAQTTSLFEPVLVVDGRPITLFELDQRRRFLNVLGVEGDLTRQAEDALIEERLQQAEAERMGVRLSNEELQAGLAEFASRTGLSVDDFVRALGDAGIAPQTFRDFVQVGIVWRKVVRARFARLGGEITEAEVDRELSTLRQGEGVMVSLSEIVVPASEAEGLAALAAGLTSEAAFAEAARTRSIAPSAVRGGRLAPVPAAYLGPQAAQVLETLPVGGISPPLRVPEGIAIYLKRGAQAFGGLSPRLIEVETVTITASGADDAALAAAAALLRAEARDCGALQARALDVVAAVLPDAEVRHAHGVLSQMPPGTAAAIAGLDEGELAVNPRPGEGRGVVMLCARRLASGLPTGIGASEDSDAARVRTAVRDTILNRRLVTRAALYLADLRADARIERP